MGMRRFLTPQGKGVGTSLRQARRYRRAEAVG